MIEFLPMAVAVAGAALASMFKDVIVDDAVGPSAATDDDDEDEDDGDEFEVVDFVSLSSSRNSFRGRHASREP